MSLGEGGQLDCFKAKYFFSKGGEASIQFSPIIALQFLVINSIDQLKIYDNHREGKTY